MISIVMSKQKTVLDKATDAVQDFAGDAMQATQHLGMAAMTTAALISMVAHDESKKVLVPTQPVLAIADENNVANNPIRREKENNEETGAHYVSYTVAQRTPARSGKH